MKCLVILPTFNECENLPRIVPAILEQGEHFDVLIVDDNSPDGTGRMADEMAASEPRVTVLHRAQKSGLGTAYVAGFKQALAGVGYHVGALAKAGNQGAQGDAFSFLCVNFVCW